MKSSGLFRTLILPLFLLALCCAATAQTEVATTRTDPVLDQLHQKTATLMGVTPGSTARHVYLLKYGGAIEITAKDGADKTSIASVQKFLEKQTKAFQAGDINMVKEAHDQLPPSMMTIKKLRSEISFDFAKVENGGAIRMFTVNPEARQAIYDFLKFEIEQHKTGDSMDVQQ